MNQLTLIPETEYQPPATDWHPDDWETPDKVAKEMASLVRPDEFVLEPFAGTGQIAKFLNGGTLTVNELNPLRCNQLKRRLVRHEIEFEGYNCDFFNSRSLFWQDIRFPFDVVCTNPPFSRLVEAIAFGLQALDKVNPEARLLYLLPGNWEQTKVRYAGFKELNCHIHHIHKIVGRVAYLKNGVPHRDRQIDDAIFDIRPGKEGGCTTYFVV